MSALIHSIQKIHNYKLTVHYSSRAADITELSPYVELWGLIAVDKSAAKRHIRCINLMVHGYKIYQTVGHYIWHCTFCSLVFLDPRLAAPWTYFLHLSLSSGILMDSFTASPVHVLMLSIQAVCGLPRLRAPGIVPCIISFSRQLPCFLMV